MPKERMLRRLRVLGAVLCVLVVGLATVGFFYGNPQADDGFAFAQAIFDAQGVTLGYNQEGQVVERGPTEAPPTTH